MKVTFQGDAGRGSKEVPWRRAQGAANGNRITPMKPLRIIVYGLGTMGRLSAAYARQKGAEIVAVYMRTTAGKDFSAPELQGAAICTPDVPFEVHQADVMLITHGTTIDQLHDPAARAARAGLDVLTIAEDAFEPFYADAEAARCRDLDALFRSHGRTMVSVGVQDSFWYAQPMAFLSAAQEVRRLLGRNTCDLSLFGTAGAHGHGIGLTPAEFDAGGHAEPGEGRGIFEVALRPLVRGLGLRVVSSTRHNLPVLAEEDIDLPDLGVSIRKGTTRGHAEKVVFTLSNGMVAEGEFHMCYMHKGETPYNEWRIEGTPSMTMRSDDFHGDVITCAALVNRIPDVLAAPAGFLSVDQLPPARHYVRF